jgi:hypothetical protein
MVIGIAAGVLLLLVGICCYYSRNKSGSPQSNALSEPLLDANQNHEMQAMPMTTAGLQMPVTTLRVPNSNGNAASELEAMFDINMAGARGLVSKFR